MAGNLTVDGSRCQRRRQGSLHVVQSDADRQMRAFNTDRPTKSNVLYTVDAGHFQYEGDLFICGYNNTSTPDTNTTAWTVGNPTFKLGLLNNVDFEVNFSFYNSVRATQVSTGASAIAQGIGDTSCASSGTSLVTMTTGRRWR
jgi:hypothetical protein